MHGSKGFPIAADAYPKVKKLFRKVSLNRFNSHSMGEFVNDFTIKLQLISAVKLL